MKVIENTVVKSNTEIASGIWELVADSPKICSEYRGPGQFVSILPIDGWQHPLRRPMSIAAVKKSSLTIIYKIFGDVTSEFSKLQKGDNLNMLGPIGNTFSGWDDSGYDPVLVGGGVGLAPILNLKNTCADNGIAVAVIIGARRGAEHFMDHDPDNGLWLTTDDGSLGAAGTVMPTLEDVIASLPNPRLFACGPEPMLEAVRDFSIAKGIPAELSVESYMACGIELCQGCVIAKPNGQDKKNSYHERYSLVCADGPIYEAKDISFG
ncbi:MAG: hypothetical protein QF845_00065 [Candidatus Marinimicrobia bacterium]|jgi:dihydroorotate dehydrogenase electron transfer subunit|nr:hypothetical protein [Candidatus Neomarinimicrobiota bacterium]MDP6788911.1 hypothetical protein [Candidatus Neomarinimicrobiota bacterium]MDP7072313.1 hypothetical protein [Candidatus Neomarinimicrobiota bacterium]